MRATERGSCRRGLEIQAALPLLALLTDSLAKHQDLSSLTMRVVSHSLLSFLSADCAHDCSRFRLPFPHSVPRLAYLAAGEQLCMLACGKRTAAFISPLIVVVATLASSLPLTLAALSHFPRCVCAVLLFVAVLAAKPPFPWVSRDWIACTLARVLPSPVARRPLVLTHREPCGRQTVPRSLKRKQ